MAIISLNVYCVFYTQSKNTFIDIFNFPAFRLLKTLTKKLYKKLIKIDSKQHCSLASTLDGRISAAAPLALADQLPLPMIVKRGWSS